MRVCENAKMICSKEKANKKLLLYAALAIALLLSPLLWFIAKIFRGDKYKKGPKRLNRWPKKYDDLSDLYKPRLKRDEDRFTK